MKKVLFVFAAIIISFLAVEIFLGYVLWIKKSHTPSAIYYTLRKMYSRVYRQTDTSFIPKTMYVTDEYLGYANTPGSYTVKIKDRSTGRYHSFATTINKEGNRITSFAPELFEGKKSVWIFGDSFAFGWGNNDETTFPFFLQQFLPNFSVVNYAGCGYGNIHAYLQIKKELEKAKDSPAIIVIVYGDYFNVRNVAAPSRLKEYRYNDASWENIDPSKWSHPKAVLNHGKLEIEYVPLFWKFNKPSGDKDPSKEYQRDVTKEILREIYGMAEKSGSKLILAFIVGDNSDEVVAFCRKMGYFISDIRPKAERNEWDSFGPFNGHPGPWALGSG